MHHPCQEGDSPPKGCPVNPWDPWGKILKTCYMGYQFPYTSVTCSVAK